ncbi:MAG: hypothetical protein LUG98_12460 [Tannerellaceae bacterium]|nr:hypothetical protein [Tannerellaceae bacterium]
MGINYHKLDQATSYLGVYNKKDQSVKVTDKLHIQDPEYGFFDGMLQTATSDGQLAGLIDAADFIENMNSKSVFTIGEEDNPVVVIIE